MDLIARFAAYADDFERSYSDGDWSRLRPYFADDAVYESVAPEPFGFRVVGRDAILAHFETMTLTFDRRFATRSMHLDPARTEGQRVSVSGVVVYTVAGAPACRLPFIEMAGYRGGEIIHLEDAAAPEAIDEVTRWMIEHGAKLRP